MARLVNDDAQWIILLGFIISISIFFLALIANESVLVGQTTAESVLDLPKSDIQDLRDEVFRSAGIGGANSNWQQDIIDLSILRKNSVVTISIPVGYPVIPPDTIQTLIIHYNNGVTNYDETFYLTQ